MKYTIADVMDENWIWYPIYTANPTSEHACAVVRVRVCVCAVVRVRVRWCVCVCGGACAVE